MTPGWYADPTGRYELRWHNGDHWTADVAVHGERYVDALTPPAPPPPGGSGLAVAAMVLGIIALLTAWIPFVFVVGLVLAVLALVFGIIAIRRRSGDRRSFAVAGTVLGAVAIPVALGGLALTVFVVQRVLDPGPFAVDTSRCEVVDGRAIVEGTIRNEDDVERAYSLRVTVERAGTDNVLGEDWVTVRAVAPGETEPFAAELFVRTERISCQVDVYGEIPIDLGG